VILRDASDAPAGSALTITVDRGSVAVRSEGEIAEGAAARSA
jgi:exodeoxyribonuclease VII large subunit